MTQLVAKAVAFPANMFLRPRNGSIPAPKLPVAYQHGVVLFRTLYTYVGLMPTQKLLRRLAKVKVHANALKICCRIVSGESISSRDGLSLPLIEGEGQVLDRFSFGNVDTPAGEMHINVSFRQQCDFKVDDSEAALSSQFLNFDERYFQPSLSSHQRIASQPPSLGRQTPAAGNPHNRTEYQQHGSSFPIATESSPVATRAGHHAAGVSLSSSPADQNYLRSVQGSRSSLRSVENAGVPRRPSVSFMQPFKSPSLSNSPSTSYDIPPSPRTSVTRITSTATAPIQARARSGVTAAIQKNSTSYDTGVPMSSSPRPLSVNRYSSSFGPRKPRPGTAGRIEDDNSSGRGSYSSSIAAPGSGILNDPAMGNSIPNDDQKVAEFLKLLDEPHARKMFGSSDSTKKTNTALLKFQKMRDSHNALSDSMSSSLLVPRSGSPATSRSQLSNAPLAATASSFSPSSSPSKIQSSYTPHTPTVPSRLSAEQTVVYQGHYEQNEFSDSRQSPENTRQSAEQASTTSPLDIPSSPQPYQSPRRPSSYSQQVRNFGNDPSEFGPPQDFGPTSTSLQSVDMRPLSPGKLAELRLASEEEMPGRENVAGARNSPHPSRESDRSLQHRGDFNRGYAGSPSPSVRSRLSRGNGRGTPPGGSSTNLVLGREHPESISGERPLLGRRTPSYPGAGFTEEEPEDLLFAMSDYRTRRSTEQDRFNEQSEIGRTSNNATGVGAYSSSRRRSRGNGNGGY